MRPYTEHAERLAPEVMRARARAAADAAAGLAKLVEISARQEVAAAQVRLNAAQGRLDAARAEVTTVGLAHLRTAVRQWCNLRSLP
ncbi:hypothetical protein Q8791_17170 [Nocardiopsis sp. CT-R113]|uniref:Uncharacterized protein n=1 Tax=Nocardiopsis codii TaxID=3065942 RepID=A0ABU7K9M5_9ACTN|nr:hypothetical protein [Nocardiopsis sp. CT-R113]MEE2038951.1 hypothetical protein [Nocardiopsis sp. CT-R113]